MAAGKSYIEPSYIVYNGDPTKHTIGNHIIADSPYVIHNELIITPPKYLAIEYKLAELIKEFLLEYDKENNKEDLENKLRCAIRLLRGVVNDTL